MALRDAGVPEQRGERLAEVELRLLQEVGLRRVGIGCRTHDNEMSWKSKETWGCGGQDEKTWLQQVAREPHEESGYQKSWFSLDYSFTIMLPVTSSLDLSSRTRIVH